MSETREEIKTAKDFTESAIDAIEQYWTFDNNQQHTHSWHEKQKCLDNLRKLLPLYFDVYHSQFPPQEVTDITDEEIRSIGAARSQNMPSLMAASGFLNGFKEGAKWMRSKLNK